MDREWEIIGCEEKLLRAFQDKDIGIVDELLHDNLFFILPNGQTITKAMDMENIRSGNMAIHAISSSDRVIHLVDDTAIVSLTLYINGKYFDQLIDAKFRYLRVWKLFNEKWKVIAGSGVPLL